MCEENLSKKSCQLPGLSESDIEMLCKTINSPCLQLISSVNCPVNGFFEILKIGGLTAAQGLSDRIGPGGGFD